jgi:hydrogenase maturation protease
MSAAAAAGTVVIGVGNRLCGDDVAGLEVARMVRERAGHALRVFELDGEPSGLLDAWEAAEFAVVIDASASGAAPGTVHRFDAAEGPLPGGLRGSSTHALGVADAIELGRALGRLPARLTVYGIEGQRFGAGALPSAAVEDAITAVAESVVAEVAH